jgi:hypothetical protein
MPILATVNVKDFSSRGIILRHTGLTDQALRSEVDENYV